MDKKNFPSLDELLNKVRQSEPVIQEDEAINWLYAQKELPLRKHRFKPAKIIIMTSIISSIGIAALLWIFGQGRGDRVRLTDQTMDHRPWTMDGSLNLSDERFQSSNEGSTKAPGSTAAMVHGPSTMVQDPSTLVDTPRVDTFKVIKIREEINGLGKGDPQMQVVVELAVDQPAENSNCKAEVNALEPDSEQLKKLGIVSDGGALMYQQERTKKGQLKLTFDGLILTNYSTKLTGLGHLKAPDILPLGVMNCKGQWMFPDGNERPEDKVLEDALAVKVPVVGVPGYLIFWFPRNEAFYNMLGSELTREVLENSDKYHQLPWEFEKPTQGKNPAIPLEKIFWESEETIIPMGSYMDDLGFNVNEKGIKFKRKRTKVDISRKGFYIDQVGQFNEEEQFSETNVKKCVPFYITRDFFNKGEHPHVSTLRSDFTNSRDWQREFTFDKFRMVAFRIEHPTEGAYLFWYPYSSAIREMLSPEERERLDKKLSLIDPAMRYTSKRPEFKTLDAMFVDERPGTEALNALTPSVSVLNKLGVQLLPDSGIRVSIWAKTALVVDDFYKEATRFVGIFGDSVINEGRRDSLALVHNALVYITDDLGSNFHMYVNSSDQSLNSLIPVLVRSGKTYTLHDKIVRNWRPDIILWFKPTPELLAILESDGAEAIWGDITSTEIPDTSTVDCRYTEICRNKPGVFHNQMVFPNPATTYANFSWTSDEAANYSIKLYALNGKEVRAFEGLSAQAGKNQYMMDLSSLPPGIYMMILSSDKGDELHERLVIRE